MSSIPHAGDIILLPALSSKTIKQPTNTDQLITLIPLKGGVNTIDRLTKFCYKTLDPGMYSRCHLIQTSSLDSQAYSPWHQHILMTVGSPTGKCILWHHNNCSGNAKETWQSLKCGHALKIPQIKTLFRMVGQAWKTVIPSWSMEVPSCNQHYSKGVQSTL